MKDVVGIAGVAILLVLLALFISILDSCRDYQVCMKTHSVKTCNANFGTGVELDDSEY